MDPCRFGPVIGPRNPGKFRHDLRKTRQMVRPTSENHHIFPGFGLLDWGLRSGWAFRGLPDSDDLQDPRRDPTHLSVLQNDLGPLFRALIQTHLRAFVDEEEGQIVLQGGG